MSINNRQTSAKSKQKYSSKNSLSNSQNIDKISALASESIWIDRISKELKGQREYSSKWGALVDHKLYADDDNTKTSKYTITKWSAFSVINPPGKDPSPFPKREVPPGVVPPLFKITGDRQSNRTRRYPVKTNAWESFNTTTDYTRSSDSYGSSYAHKSKNSVFRNTTPERNHTSCDKRTLSSVQNAPFATETTVEKLDIKKLERSHLSSLIMYNSTLVGSRANQKTDFARDPQSIYKCPVTNSMEYGWTWGGRKKLELY